MYYRRETESVEDRVNKLIESIATELYYRWKTWQNYVSYHKGIDIFIGFGDVIHKGDPRLKLLYNELSDADKDYYRKEARHFLSSISDFLYDNVDYTRDVLKYESMDSELRKIITTMNEKTKAFVKQLKEIYIISMDGNNPIEYNFREWLWTRNEGELWNVLISMPEILDKQFNFKYYHLELYYWKDYDTSDEDELRICIVTDNDNNKEKEINDWLKNQQLGDYCENVSVKIIVPKNYIRREDINQ